MSSPSKVTKVNYLYIRHLCFRSVRGDLQEGNGCASRCLFPLFLVPIPGFPSTKSGFLCAFALWNPHFPAFRAQNRGFCAFWGSGALIFEHFEHKIRVFVLFWPLEPSFSGVSSTKSGFLCSRGGESGIVKRNREDAYHFAAAPTPSHQRTRTLTPAHQHQCTGTAMAPAQQRHQEPLLCRLVPSRRRYGTALD